MNHHTDETDRMLDVLRSSRAGDFPEMPGPRCLDEAVLAALADGAAEETLRAGSMRHVAVCAYCRTALASIVTALADPEVAAAAAAADAPPRWRRRHFAVPAAAAAVLAVALLGRYQTPQSPTHRAGYETSEQQPRAVAPVGPGLRPGSLRWESVPGADRYRVTLYRDDGRVLFAHELTDTVVALPDSIDLLPGDSYLWMLEARTGWDRWSSSRLHRFSVERDPAP